MFVNQPDHCLNWGHLGVLGWRNEVTPFHSCGSSLVTLCATSMKRPDRVFALGKSADFQSMCCCRWLKVLKIIVFKLVVLFSQKSRGRVCWLRVKTAAFGGRQLYVLHILPITLGEFLKTFFFLIFLSLAALCLRCIHGISPICCGMCLVPWSGLKPGPSDWEQTVLVTGPGKSLLKLSESQLFHLQNGIGILWPWEKF